MRLVASAYSIAQKAGTIVRCVIAEGDLGIVQKTSATDLQTKADRLVQMSICSSLARKFPKLTIIGEEDLPPGEVDQELIEDGQWEEILKQPCPSQYSAIKEEDKNVKHGCAAPAPPQPVPQRPLSPSSQSLSVLSPPHPSPSASSHPLIPVPQRRLSPSASSHPLTPVPQRPLSPSSQSLSVLSAPHPSPSASSQPLVSVPQRPLSPSPQSLSVLSPPHPSPSASSQPLISVPQRPLSPSSQSCSSPLRGERGTAVGLLDNVTVLIGIAYEGKAIAGIINQPYYNYQAGPDAVLGRTIWGVLGLGAFGFQLKEAPAGKHIITTTRSHSNKLVTDCVSAMNPDNVLRVGGAGNKIIQLIEGKASAYVFASPGCKKWDTCAPEVILHAVGGKLTDIHGNALQYNKEVKHMNSAGVLAALRNYEYYASRVPESVKNALTP
ncbi:bisphosphate 3'-nucleotidase 1 [Cricetulus griseus]